MAGSGLTQADCTAPPDGPGADPARFPPFAPYHVRVPARTARKRTQPARGPAGHSPFVLCRDVVRTYGEGDAVTSALRGVSCAIGVGEFAVILGQSGSGKSTLLGLIGGLERPTSGEIEVGGRNLAGLSDRDLTEYRRRDVGFIFQSFNLLPTLTARENVALMAELGGRRGMAPEDLLDAVGLAHRMDRFPASLSGGEQQRVAVAAALAKNPALVLADEPTGNLDDENGAIVLNLMHRMRQESGTTFVVVTHNQALVEGATQVVHLASGQVVTPSP